MSEDVVLLALEILVPWLILVLITMIVVTYLALRWGRDPFGWLLFSAAMGPIAIIALVGTRHRDIEQRQRPRPAVGQRQADAPLVLIGADGSASGPRIARHVLDTFGSDVDVVITCVLPHEAEPRGNALAQRDCDARVQAMTRTTIDELIAGGARARTEVGFGIPGEQLVRIAEDNGADVIVIGRRGAGLTRALLGSVSDHVVKHATRPVLIVD